MSKKLKVTDEKSRIRKSIVPIRIRIRTKMSRIHNTGITKRDTGMFLGKSVSQHFFPFLF